MASKSRRWAALKDGLVYFGGLPPAGLFFIMGISHFSHHDVFVVLVPTWIPFKSICVYLTGLCQMAGAFGLIALPFFDSTMASDCCVALLALVICMAPANIHAYENDLPIAGHHLEYSWRGHWLQLTVVATVIVWLAVLAVLHRDRPPLKENIFKYLQARRRTSLGAFVSSSLTEVRIGRSLEDLGKGA